jgi:hypothetical protein
MRMIQALRFVVLFFAFVLPMARSAVAASPPDSRQQQKHRVELRQHESEGQLQVLIDGKEAIAYQYGKNIPLPHYYPVRGPSGQLLTDDNPKDHIHHCSIWFADTVRTASAGTVSFYHSIYSQDGKRPEAGYRDRVRHAEFLKKDVVDGKAIIEARLVWETDYGRAPMLDEWRRCRVVPLADGEYFLDLNFRLTASYGDVAFVGDAKEYAWPFVRMAVPFSAAKGGVIANSAGGANEKGTFLQPAQWIDYSATVNGATEGLAIFAADKDSPRWFTRDYGIVGPRRPDGRNGTPFTVKKGDRIGQHVGILVHSGDARSGGVQQRYQQFIDGEF